MEKEKGKIWLSRSIQDHWISQDPVFFRRWIFILMNVNWKDDKVKIGMHVYKCKRGQAMKSLRTWAIILNCGINTVKRTFSLLEKQGALTLEITGFAQHRRTRVTITNYDDFQSRADTRTDTRTDTRAEHKRIHSNNVNNVNKKEILQSFSKRDLILICEKKKLKHSGTLIHGFFVKSEMENFKNENDLASAYVSYLRTRKDSPRLLNNNNSHSLADIAN